MNSVASNRAKLSCSWRVALIWPVQQLVTSYGIEPPGRCCHVVNAQPSLEPWRLVGMANL